jgi:hypothetical protein
VGVLHDEYVDPEALHQLGQGAEQAMPGRLGIGESRQRGWESVPELWEERAQRATQRAQRELRGLDRPPSKAVDDGAEREGLGERRAGGDGDPAWVVQREALLDEPRLPDARLSRDEDERRWSLDGGCHRGQVVRVADERRCTS